MYICMNEQAPIITIRSSSRSRQGLSLASLVRCITIIMMMMMIMMMRALAYTNNKSV